MKVDVLLGTEAADRDEVGRRARELAEAGLDGAFTYEGGHDAFLPLALAAGAAPLDLYTNVAIALPRSPVHLAHLAWDLQRLSGGRFLLGLGSQVRAHVVRRHGAAWDRPAARMREWVQATRAVLACWQDGAPLDFRGEFLQLDLMPPTFSPGPNPHGAPPVLLAGVGPRMTEAAGAVADGFVLHPFNSAASLSQVTRPALERGRAQAAGRDFVVIAGAIVATGADEEAVAAARESARNIVAFYGSTPAYRVVLDAEGYGPLQEELRDMTRQGRWADMAGAVGDDLLDRLTFTGAPEEVGRALAQRYGGFADRVALSTPSGADPEVLGRLADGARSAAPDRPPTGARAGA